MFRFVYLFGPNGGDPVRRLKFTLVIVAALGGLTLLLSALDAQAQALGLQTPPATTGTMWNPQAVLAVASVIFSFGVSWQTLRVHAREIRDLKQWKEDAVTPALTEHAVAIAGLQGAKKARGH